MVTLSRAQYSAVQYLVSCRLCRCQLCSLMLLAAAWHVLIVRLSGSIIGVCCRLVLRLLLVLCWLSG
jgi:hypothetical protein